MTTKYFNHLDSAQGNDNSSSSVNKTRQYCEGRRSVLTKDLNFFEKNRIIEYRKCRCVLKILILVYMEDLLYEKEVCS